jgi:hypothetical protein
MSALLKEGGTLTVTSFREKTRLSEHSAMNVARDLRLLGLATMDSGSISSAIETRLESGNSELLASVRAHVKERLGHNRLVSRLLGDLKTDESLTLIAIGQRLANWCPYVSATPDTWKMYARILATWMDLADLATFNGRDGTLSYYEPSTELRERDVRFASRRSAGSTLPVIQYSPVENVARMIADTRFGKRPEWKGLTKSTLQKAFATLEDFGFLIRTPSGSYKVTDALTATAGDLGHLKTALATAVSNIPAFITFLQLLKEHCEVGLSQLLLGRALRERLNIEWRDGTAQTNVKISLDWARHTGVAPGIFAKHPRRPS